MNEHMWDPARTIGSDIHVLREMVRHLGDADPKLVRSFRAELRTAFIDLALVIGRVEDSRGKDWRDLLGGSTSSKTAQ